jgi:hypothetical protein
MSRSEGLRDSAERKLGDVAVVQAEVEESFLASVFSSYNRMVEETGTKICPFTDRSCLVLSCLVLSCLVLSCLVLSLATLHF